LGSLGSWKVGAEYVPVDSLRLRAVVANSVRAPNLAELFDPGDETFESFIDPCLNGGASGAGSTAVNCTSLGIPADYDPGSAGGSAGGIQAGSANLQEERADTQTIGFVYTPGWLDGASLTVDYFNIEIEDAIELIDPQVKLDQCYAAADFPNNVFCGGIQRNGADLDFLINRLDFGLENIGILKTSGIDMEFNYGFDALGGDFHIRTLVTKTNDWEREVNGIVDSDYEEPGLQEWKANTRLTYSNGPWSSSWTSRFIGVNNVTGEDAPYIPTPSANADTGTGTAAGVYDVVGQFFYTGLEIRF
jgi:iron complex outermembrane receptor protein